MDLLAAYATILHPADSVAVVKRRIPTGTSVEGPEGILQIAQEIPPGHKIAVRAVAAGQPVLKYGQFIGWASAVIRPCLLYTSPSPRD